MKPDPGHGHHDAGTGAADHLGEDRLIDLVHDLVDETTRRTMLDHLQACGLCESHLRMLVREHEALRTRPAPRIDGGRLVAPDDLRARSAAGETPAPAAAGGGIAARRRRARLGWIGGGLAVAAAALVFVALNVMRPDVSGAGYWMPPPPRNAPAPPGLAVLDDALRAYDEHDPERALALLENARVRADDHRTEAIRRLYQASALVNAGRPGQALEVLEGLDARLLEDPWRARAEWVRYLALRDAGRRADAEAQLRRIERLQGDRDVDRRVHDERARLNGD